MERILLEISKDVHSAMLKHLLPENSPDEQAAFLFVRPTRTAEGVVFRLIDWHSVAHDDFAHQSPYFMELTDKERGYVIKRAYDLDASLIEVHSHRSWGPASFSASDRAGLKEFVPHVWWRLKRRPYIALVVAVDTFDALAWTTDARMPRTLDGLIVGDHVLKPTGISRRWWE